MSDDRSRDEDTAGIYHVCKHCDASIANEARFCWLCGAPTAAREPDAKPVEAEIVPVSDIEFARELDSHAPPRDARQGLGLHVGIWAAVVVAALTGWGLLYEHPILAAGYLIVVIPSLLFGIGLSAIARVAGTPLNPISKIAFTTGVAGVLVPIAAIVCVYLAITSFFIAIKETCASCTPDSRSTNSASR